MKYRTARNDSEALRQSNCSPYIPRPLTLQARGPGRPREVVTLQVLVLVPKYYYNRMSWMRGSSSDSSASVYHRLRPQAVKMRYVFAYEPVMWRIREPQVQVFISLQSATL